MKSKRRVLLLVSVVVLLVLMGYQSMFAAQTEINLWTSYETAFTYQEMAKEYMKEHPNVKITVEQFPARSMQEKIAVTLPLGAACDIIEDGTAPMEPYIGAGLISKPPEWAQSYVDDSVYDMIKPSVYNQGEVWGIPSFVGLKYLYWNEKMFREAGLSEAPKTLDELVEYAKKLTKYDNRGNVTRSGISLRLSGGGYGVAEKWWILGLAPYGGAPLVETAPGKYCGAFDTEECQKAIQLHLDLLYKHKTDSHAVEHDVEAFAREDTAMFVREGFVIDHLAKHAPDVEYDLAPIPADRYWKTMCICVSFYVPESSKNKDVAWDFVKFLSNSDNVRRKFDETGWNPVRKDVDYSPIYEDKPMYERLQYFPEGYGIYFEPLCRSFIEIWTKAGEWLTDMFTREDLVDNEQELAKECKRFNDIVNSILKDDGLYHPR